jgi:hypothetical protein
VNNIDWSKPVTFDAAKNGFQVKAIKLDKGYKISSHHWGFGVDDNGMPFSNILGQAFHVRNEKAVHCEQ